LCGGITLWSRCLSYVRYVFSSKASSLESTTRASPLDFHYIRASCKSSINCLRLPPRLPASSITQPSLQWLPLPRFRGINRQRRQADSHIQLLLRLRTNGAILHLPPQALVAGTWKNLHLIRKMSVSYFKALMPAVSSVPFRIISVLV